MLLLFFALGPLTALLPANDDPRLPACCRRNGAHHCAMSTQMLVAMMARMEKDTAPGFSAPTTCPNYPVSLLALLAPDAALAAKQLSLPILHVRAHEPAAGNKVVLEDSIRLHAGRGPPHDHLI